MNSNLDPSAPLAAHLAAYARAYHTAHDAPGICCDPLARPLLGLFTEDQEVMKITLEMMHFLVPTYLTYICVEIFSGAVRGAGDVVAPTLMTCFGVCILRVLWILVAVPMHRTVVMVEWSYPITWTLTSVMYGIYYFHGGWLRRCKEKQRNTVRQTEEQE